MLDVAWFKCRARESSRDFVLILKSTVKLKGMSRVVKEVKLIEFDHGVSVLWWQRGESPTCATKIRSMRIGRFVREDDEIQIFYSWLQDAVGLPSKPLVNLKGFWRLEMQIQILSQGHLQLWMRLLGGRERRSQLRHRFNPEAQFKAEECPCPHVCICLLWGGEVYTTNTSVINYTVRGWVKPFSF